MPCATTRTPSGVISGRIRRHAIALRSPAISGHAADDDPVCCATAATRTAPGARPTPARRSPCTIPRPARCSPRCRAWAPRNRRAIDGAHAALPAWRAAARRASAPLLARVLRPDAPHRRDLGVIMTREQGKPIAESDAEIGYAAAFLEWMGRRASASTATRSPPSRPTRGSSCSSSRSGLLRHHALETSPRP